MNIYEHPLNPLENSPISADALDGLLIKRLCMDYYVMRRYA